MKELQEIVVTKTAEMICSGTIEKMIADNLEKAVASAVQEALRSYGEFGKVLTAKVAESIQCGAKDIEIPAYNQFIKRSVEKIFIQVLDEQAVAHMTALLEGIITPVSKESNISVLLDHVEEMWGDLARENGDESIKIDVKDSEHALYVTFHHPQYEWETVRATFYNFNEEGGRWHIGYINQNNTRITGRPTNVAKVCTHEVTDELFKYYAMGTLFAMDREIENICVLD